VYCGLVKWLLWSLFQMQGRVGIQSMYPHLPTDDNPNKQSSAGGALGALFNN
jgi:hypothetical protein